MNRISETIRDRLQEQPLIYVTRDIERALGTEPRGGYFVVSNDTSYGREIKERYPDNVFLIKSDSGLLDTYDLLALPEVGEIISKRDTDVLVFQNNPRIERLARDKKWRLLNPSAELSKQVEEKISQTKWLAEDSKLLPSHSLTILKDVQFAGSRFVLQFNHAHTGGGTHIIDTEEALKSLQNAFPYRECRITDFIEGPVFTVNAAVMGSASPGEADAAVGNPSYQITGLPPFTDNPFATVGNDWGLTHGESFKSLRAEIASIAQTVGARLEKNGWKGLFGIDVAFEEKSGKTYLLEINARQPASTTYESRLQRETDPDSPSIFEMHLASLLGIRGSSGPALIRTGAQIVLRNTSAAGKTSVSSIKEKLQAAGLSVIEYDEPGPGKEVLRIQAKDSLMKEHGIFSGLGEMVRDIIG